MSSRSVKIYGPPGTGKTHKLISTVSEEMKAGVHPSQIIFASFSRAAAREARNRALLAFPEYNGDDFGYFSTIHSICYRLLRLTPKQVFSDSHKKAFGKIWGYTFSGNDNMSFDFIYPEMSVSELGDYCEHFLSYKANRMLSFEDAYREYTTSAADLPKEFNRDMLSKYTERRKEYKQKHGLYDFPDMLQMVLENHLCPPYVRVAIFDEMQDASPLLFEVAKMWSSNVERSYFASDPYQAIYSFMGAEPGLMINFPADEVETLKQSHRCPRAIHWLSRRIVERFKMRYQDDDYIPVQKDGSIARVPVERLDWDELLKEYRSIFYLHRTRYLLRLQFDELLANGVPFTILRGRDAPLQMNEKDAVLCLRKLIDGDWVSYGLLEKLVRFMPIKPFLRRGAKTQIANQAKKEPDTLLSRARLLDVGFTPEFLHALTDSNFLDPLKISSEHKSYFLKLLSKYGRKILEKETHQVKIGTQHSAKGLESDLVIWNPELTRRVYDGYQADRDPENRLAYTTVTRSKDGLIILIPLQAWRVYPI